MHVACAIFAGPSPYKHPSYSWLRGSKRREHALYEKEKVAKTNETEKDDRSSTNNGVIARAEVTELTEQVVTFNICTLWTSPPNAQVAVMTSMQTNDFETFLKHL